jgi:hypothetical protein
MLTKLRLRPNIVISTLNTTVEHNSTSSTRRQNGWSTIQPATARSVREYLDCGAENTDDGVTRHKSILDYLHNAGFTKTFNEFREEAPELVRTDAVHAEQC